MKKICSLFLISLVLTTLLIGCSQSTTEKGIGTENADAPERRLLISTESDGNKNFTTITSDELGGNFSEDITYLGFSSVTIDVNGDTYPLEDAIRDGLITVEEIFAYARIDARNGICREKYTSKNGLAYFTYRYPGFDIRLTYDVYETPDGKQHLINDLGIFYTGANISTTYQDDEGNAIDREDWGMEFEILETTPTGITLQISQSSGQQIGDLIVTGFHLYRIDAEKTWTVPPKVNEEQEVRDLLDIPIPMNTTSKQTFDWADIYHPLEKGNYVFYLDVADRYEQSQVHPLMKNFADRLTYRIYFTVE